MPRGGAVRGRVPAEIAGIEQSVKHAAECSRPPAAPAPHQGAYNTDMPLSSSDRFLGRVETYAKYRPSYPPTAIDLLEARCGLKPGADVVDLGSGTGILSALLVKRGARVFGIEPNREMRAYADLMHGGQFCSGSGTAENTHMPDGFFDLL